MSKNKLVRKNTMTIGPSMGVGGKSHIFPGLGFNHNKEKKLFLYSERERSLSPSWIFVISYERSWVPLWHIRYESSLLECIRKCFGKLAGQSNTFNNRSKIFSDLQSWQRLFTKGIPPTAVTLQPKNTT